MPYAVAAGHDLTADTAAEVLASGGSAVDAAVAAAWVACVAEPVLAGLMGGGFLMVRPPEGRARLLDFFVQTPKRKQPEGELDFREIVADFGTVAQAFHIGAGAVATPGMVPGLFEAHARFGRMPMVELCRPAIRAAREGVAVTPYQAKLGAIVGPILAATASSRALYCEGDRPLTAGAVFRNPDLADVIEVMAHEGARFVTEGEIATGLLALTVEGGHVSRADLAGYRPEWREPLLWERGGVRIALNPAPALGGLLIAFPLALLGSRPDPLSVARAFHATARARIELALHEDPDEGGRRLLSEALLDRYRKGVLGRQAAVRGTTQISVIDTDGMGVALTVSNGEGCGRVIPGTGIMPNNMLGEDDLVPGDWQSWQPDRRLSSMMAPMAVSWPDGRLAVLGSGGSNRIRTALAQVLLRLIDDRLGLQAAIEAPRLHVEGADAPQVDFELPGLAEADREALLAEWPEARGWDELSMFYGGAHAAIAGKAWMEAAGDLRRAGSGRTG